MKLTRKQMIGLVDRIDGKKIVKFVKTSRDSRGVHLTVFEVTNALGETQLEAYWTSELTTEWFIPDGEKADEIRQKAASRILENREWLSKIHTCR